MSYDGFLSQLRGGFEREAKCLVDDASDTGIKFKLLASELARLEELLAYYKLQIFPDTAEGEFLLKHGELHGIIPKEAAPAKGNVTFTCKTAVTENLTIPAGTLCASSKGEGLLFRTTEDRVIEQGKTYATVPVEATESGADTNLAPHLLDILVTPIPGVSQVDNSQRLDGGADAESEESLRKRVVESYSKVSNGANLAYYEQFARSIPGVQFAKAVYTTGTTSQVLLYVENLTRTLAPAVVSQVQQQAESVRETGVRVIARRPTAKRIKPTLSIKVDNLANQHAYGLDVEAELEKATQELGIGERWSPSKIAARLLTVPGVLDVTFTSPAAPVEVGAGEIPVLNGIELSVEGAEQGGTA